MSAEGGVALFGICDKNMAVPCFFAIPCGLVYGLRVEDVRFDDFNTHGIDDNCVTSPGALTILQMIAGVPV